MIGDGVFWDVGPHEPVPVEETWDEFVRQIGGARVSDDLPKSPSFDNADYIFRSDGVVLELKEIETEFLKSAAAIEGFELLLRKLTDSDPSWRPQFLGGEGTFPAWFKADFIRLARPALLRILKKANKQIRQTKAHYGLSSPNGVLVVVNDGFTGLAPDLVIALSVDALVHSYSSVDCFIYTTLNRYIEISGSLEPKLIWSPSYSERASDDLVTFVNNLGRQWFDFLEARIGPFTSREEGNDRSILLGSKSIVLPHEER